MPERDLTAAQYRHLLELRTALRGFLHWSQTQAARVGLTASQHQLLLAVVGHGRAEGPTIGEVADYLYLRHHSAVGLVSRAESAGLVRRVPDATDARLVRLQATPAGRSTLRALSRLHLDELSRLAAHLQPLLAGLDVEQSDRGGSRHL